MSSVKSVDRQNNLWRVLKPAAQQIGVGISPRQRTGDGARFWVDRELNALQNSCIADLQVQPTNKRGDTCRVAGDGYRGVICLIGAREMGKDHEDGAKND